MYIIIFVSLYCYDFFYKMQFAGLQLTIALEEITSVLYEIVCILTIC